MSDIQKEIVLAVNKENIDLHDPKLLHVLNLLKERCGCEIDPSNRPRQRSKRICIDS